MASPLEGEGGYAEGEVERFDKARRQIVGRGINGLVSLHLGSKVRMTLGEWEAIGAEMERLREEVDRQQSVITAVRTAVT